MNTLAKRLAWARDRKNWTQEQLANAAGTTQGTIGHLESGRRQAGVTIIKIAEVLEVSVAWLKDGIGDPNDNVVQSGYSEMILTYVTQEEAYLITQYREANKVGRLLIQSAITAAPKLPKRT